MTGLSFFPRMLCMLFAFGTAHSTADCCGVACADDAASRDFKQCDASPAVQNPFLFCADSVCCDVEPSSPGSSLQPGSLEVSVDYSVGSYGGPAIPTINVAWKYRNGVSPEKVKVVVSFMDNRSLCYYLEGSTRRVQVSSLPDYDAFQSCGYDIQVQVRLGKKTYEDTTKVLKTTLSIPDCWTAVGKNRSLVVCGVQIPSAPLNVSAELRVNSSTGVSTIAVNWSPPLHHNSPVDMYLVEAYCGAESNMSISAKSFHPPPGRAGARMQLGTADNLSLVKVRAGVRSGGGREFSLCLHESVDGTPYCFGAVGVAQVTIATSDAHTAPAAQLSTSSPVFQAPYYKGGLVAVIVMGGTAVCFMLLKFAMLL